MAERSESRAEHLLIYIAGCLLAGTGLWMMVSEFVRRRSAYPCSTYLEGIAVLMLASIVFMDGMSWIRRVSARRDAESEHRSEPWLWRDDWAKSVVYPNGRGAHRAIAIAAIYWLGLLPFATRVDRRYVDWFEGGALLILGLALASWAIWRVAKRSRQRGWVCRLKQVPIVPGSNASGTIETRLGEITPIELTLVCTEEIEVDSARYHHGPVTQINELHRTNVTVAVHELQRTAAGIAIPFSIPIPDAGPASRMGWPDPAGSGAIIWLLSVRARTSGVDCSAAFPLPVFLPGGAS